MQAPSSIRKKSQCGRKKKFRSVGSAAESAARYNYYQAVFPNDRLDVYYCAFCRHFHIGHGYYKSIGSHAVHDGTLAPNWDHPSMAYLAKVGTMPRSIWRCAWPPARGEKVWARPDMPGSKWEWLHCDGVMDLGTPTRHYWLYKFSYV